MTDQELDVWMRRVLLDAARQDADCTECGALDFSPSARHRRQMRRMLNHPLGWQRERERPAWRGTARRVAAALLILSLSLGGVAATIPSVRAVVAQWLVEWYETHIIYRYNGAEEPAGAMPQYALAQLPEGYAEAADKRTQSRGYVGIVYENGAGDGIYLDYVQLQLGSAIDVVTDGVDPLPVTVNGCQGHLYLSQTPGQGNSTITWIDSERNLQFILSAPLEQDGLERLAEQVSPVKK